jgi:hypothetical protein
MRQARARPCRLPGAWLWRRGSAPLRRGTDRVEGVLALLALVLSLLAVPVATTAGSHLADDDGDAGYLAAAAREPDAGGAGQAVAADATWGSGTSGLTYAETAPPGRAGPSTAAAEVGVLTSGLWLAVVWGGFAVAHRTLDRRRLRQWDAAWARLHGRSP